MAERPELRLVREHLESMLSPAVASSALFDALGASGSPPKSAAETVRLVEGPLRGVLASRLRPGEAESLVADVLAALRPALTQEAHEVPRGRGDATLEVPVSQAGEAVRLVVMSSDEVFAVQIEGALGPSRVSAVTLRSASGLGRIAAVAMSAPEIVVIDASRFPPIEPAELAASLRGLPATTAKVIWGAELPYGASLMRDLALTKSTATTLDRAEGVEPLLDLVRSRSGRETRP